MAPRIELPWPNHGESEDRAHAKQLDLTTPYSRNCRTHNAKTLRAQGGQRAGWKDYLSTAIPGGKKIDALASVTVDLPKNFFEAPGKNTLTEEWGHRVPGLRECVAVDTDDDGNVYSLDPSGLFQRIGSDGEVDLLVTFHVPALESVVPRIQVDSRGNVYVATSHPAGFSGRVLKFERLEDGDDDFAFNRAWEHSGFYGVRDFRVRAGVLVVSRFYSEQTQKGPPADVIVLGQLEATSPTKLYETATPSPVSTIALNDQGEILGASPANAGRTAILGDEDWATPVESWSPHELEDVTGFGASRRMHFQIDANTLSGDHVDGTVITRVSDRRWLQTSLDFTQTEAISEDDGALSGGGDAIYVPPTDQTARPLSALPFVDLPSEGFGGEIRVGINSDIVFRPNGAGTAPTIQFPGTNRSALATRNLVSGSGTKSDTNSNGTPNDDGIMPQQAGVVPTYAKSVFATFLVIRYNFREDRSEMIWAHPGKNGVQYALYMNADSTQAYVAGGGFGVSRGKLTLHVGQGGNPLAEDFTSSGTPHAANQYRVLSCDLTASDFDNPQNVAIICIQHAGSTSADGPAAAVNGHSLFRVNGRTVDRFTMVEGNSQTLLRMSMFGNIHDSFQGTGGAEFLKPFGSISGNATQHGGPWNGHLMECVTILGDTSTATLPNEDAVTAPLLTGGSESGLPAGPGQTEEWTDMTGVVYGTDAQAYTDQASEIERMEGHLAYKWGCPNVLKGGAAPAAAVNGLTNMHPFGLGVDGVSSTSPVPPVGSPTAGAFDLSDAAVALRSPKEILFKIGSSGKVAWALAGGGHGLGVQTGPDGSVIAVGRQDGGAAVVAKRVRDLGAVVRTTGEDTWELEEKGDIATEAVPGLAIDPASNLYWPRVGAPFSVRIDFVSLPNVNESIFLTDPAGGSQEYRFQSTVTVATGVLRGSTIEDAAANFAAAVTNSGDNSVQYDSTRVAHISWKASVETDGSLVYVRVTRYGAEGFAQVTVPVAYVRLQLSDLPTSASQPAGQHTANFGTGIEHRVEMLGAEDGLPVWSRPFSVTGRDNKPLAVAINPIIPKYPESTGLEGTTEHVYIGQRANVGIDGVTIDNPDADNLTKIRQVQRKQVIDENQSVRESFNVAVSDGSIYRVERGKPASVFTAGNRIFQRDSPFVKLFSYRQRIYGLDGQSYMELDPVTSKVQEWKAKGGGEIPYGAKLGVVWNGRVVLARTADDPHNLHMSERGNPYGWDTSPLTVTPLSAFSGASSGNMHFKLRDLVNCMIPARDDLLIVGGDTSISRLTGDPGGFGQLDNITTGEGLAFGDPYAIAPDGTVYVKGINGGIWRLGISGSADRISLGWIERRIQNINLKEYNVVMEWNFRQEGLHVFVVPKGIGEREVECYFWDAKNAGWFTDSFSDFGVQPTAIATFDGDDPDDRDVVMGCEDGQIRYEDADTANDGDDRIVSEMVFGPFNMRNQAGRLAFQDLEIVLDSSYQGCTVQLFVDDVADFVGGTEPVFETKVTPGYHGLLKARCAGNHIWIKLINGALDETWSLESMAINAYRAGGRRRTV